MKIQFRTEHFWVFESAVYRTTSCLLLLKEQAILVDPNYFPSEIEFIKQVVEKHLGSRKLLVLYTHSDFDHIVGAGAFPNSEGIASATFVSAALKEKQMQSLFSFEDQHYIERDYPLIYPEIKWVVSKDQQQLCFGADLFLCLETKGHTEDGLALFDPASGTLFVGDYLSNIEFPFIYYSCIEYWNCLTKLRAFIQDNAVRILVPGHGDICTDKQEMLQRVQGSQAYLKELIESVTEKRDFDKELIRAYPFPESMERAHADNCQLAKQEFSDENNYSKLTF